MILFTTDPETEENIVVESMGLRSWRFVLSVGFLYLKLQKQLSHGDTVGTKWFNITDHFSISVRPLKWKWENLQIYHDGMHYSYSFGPVHIYWSD